MLEKHPYWAKTNPITQLNLYLSPHQPHTKLIRGKEIHQTIQSQRRDHVFHVTSSARVTHCKRHIAASKACMSMVFPLVLGATGQEKLKQQKPQTSPNKSKPKQNKPKTNKTNQPKTENKQTNPKHSATKFTFLFVILFQILSCSQ